ncbi:MAG: hypothetical protein ACE5IR_02260, partial [bacterium]
MYFRFPILLLLLVAVAFGLVYLGVSFQTEMPSANGGHLKNLGESHDLKVLADVGLNSIQAEELRAHVYFLADDLLEGRNTGSRGARIAAHYIANQFQRLG